jgi:CRISPR/Cas system CSM-associated protein Csm3 (group 7 of RAMP superfamily)
MSNIAVKLGYTIQFTSPFHIGTGYGLAGYLDAVAVRRRDGNLYVPGASIKGRARWHLTGMLGQPWTHDLNPCWPAAGQPVCTLCNVFGSTCLEPHLCFADAPLPYQADLAQQAIAAGYEDPPKEHEQAIMRRQAQVERRSQTSISRQRGVVKEELLFVTEVGRAALAFEGTVTGVLPTLGRAIHLADGREAPADLGWLIAGLSAITQLGGRKSRGLGHCVVTVTEVAMGQPGAALEQVSEPARILRALRQEVAP